MRRLRQIGLSWASVDEFSNVQSIVHLSSRVETKHTSPNRMTRAQRAGCASRCTPSAHLIHTLTGLCRIINMSSANDQLREQSHQASLDRY